MSKQLSGHLKLLRNQKSKLMGWVLIFLIVGSIITFIQPLEYNSTAKLLIINKINQNLDAYTAAKAAEKLANNLASIIYSTSFLDTVISPDNNYLSVDLPSNENAKRKAWKKKIFATVKADTSILEITAYDKNKDSAEKLAYLIASTLVTKGQEYHGGGDEIIIRFIDKPMTSDYPTKPNILVNLGSSIILGLIFGYLISLKKFYQEED